MDENNGVSGLIKQGRNHGIAIWLGLFAMLMIHVGPLISGAQALSSLDSDTDLTEQHLYERATPATAFLPLASDTKHHQHAVMLVDESTHSQAQAEKSSDY